MGFSKKQIDMQMHAESMQIIHNIDFQSITNFSMHLSYVVLTVLIQLLSVSFLLRLAVILL